MLCLVVDQTIGVVGVLFWPKAVLVVLRLLLGSQDRKIFKIHEANTCHLSNVTNLPVQ